MDLRLTGGVDFLRKLTGDDIIATIDYQAKGRRMRENRVLAEIEMPERDVLNFVARPTHFDLIIER